MIVYTIFNDQSFNDTSTNDIVSFEQLGPENYTYGKCPKISNILFYTILA